MSIQRNMVVTTTSSLDGFNVRAYLGVVSARVVTGTNLFSDFFAGLSDVFGGRSHTYQKQLASINDEVIESLKEEAASRGANGIIGLRIDHDEISGKNKSMFMVTASGTAVTIERTGGEETPSIIASQVSGNDLASAVRKQLVIEAAANGRLGISADDWAFYSTNRVHEIAGAVLKVFDEPESQNLSFLPEHYLERSKVYFANLTGPQAKHSLHAAIVRNGAKAQRFAIDVIGELGLLDLDESKALLASGNFDLQKLALYLLTKSKQTYSITDADKLDALVVQIGDVFKARGKVVEIESRLSSKKKQIWICECGAKVKMMGHYCQTCSKDIYGFKEFGEISNSRPEKVGKSLMQQSNALRKELGETR